MDNVEDERLAYRQKHNGSNIYATWERYKHIRLCPYAITCNMTELFRVMLLIGCSRCDVEFQWKPRCLVNKTWSSENEARGNRIHDHKQQCVKNGPLCRKVHFLTYFLPSVDAAGVYGDWIEAGPKNVVLGAQRINHAADTQAIFDLENKWESKHDCNKLQN